MKQTGLTLMEILVSIGLLAIAGLLLVSTFVNSSGLFLKESVQVAQGLDVNTAFTELKDSIRESTSVVATFQIGQSPTYTSGNEHLILSLNSIDGSGNIISTSYDYYVYYKEGARMKLKTYPDAGSSRYAKDQVLIDNLETLKFTYLDSSTPPQAVTPVSATRVRTSIKLSQKAGADIQQRIATTEAIIRNGL